MYAVLPFALATGVVEVPFLILQAAIFVPITYLMIGFELAFEPFILYLIIFLQSITLYTFMVRARTMSAVLSCGPPCSVCPRRHSSFTPMCSAASSAQITVLASPR
jgi:hypothetical protein